MKWLLHIEALLQKILMAVAAFCLVAMVFMTSADIVVRQVSKPIPGVIELMGFFGALVVACALAYTQRKKDHIAVDILTNAFPKPIRKFLDIVNRLACMAFSIIAAWQITIIADTVRRTGEVTETLRMVYYPFTYMVAAGFALLAFVFFVELLRDLMPPSQQEDGQ